MEQDIKLQIQDVIAKSVAAMAEGVDDLPSVEIEKPADKLHGDLSSNIALKSAKIFKKKPLDIAADLVAEINKTLEESTVKSSIANIEVKAPGFINFYLSDQQIYTILHDVFAQKSAYGSSELGQGEKIQIEFVSANPTGPLSVAHARQAAVGDALVNILKFLDFDAHREYYVNDGGNQIRILGDSIKARALQSVGANVEFEEEFYQGEYIKDMAQTFMQDKGLKSAEDIESPRIARVYGFWCDVFIRCY